MKKIPDEAYSVEIKLDRDSVYMLCNSLNAMQHPLRENGWIGAAFYMLRAQGTIARLFEENQELKKMLESRASLDQ